MSRPRSCGRCSAFAHGEGKQATRLWPLYGTTRFQESSPVFALWPLVLPQGRAPRPPRTAHHPHRVLRVHRHRDEEPADREDRAIAPTSGRCSLSRRDHGGNERFQVLSLLSPILPENTSVQRLYEPLWALWRAEKNAQTGAKSQSLLWNLYRRETTPEVRKMSLPVRSRFSTSPGPRASGGGSCTCRPGSAPARPAARP